jgi:hypothetical protein
MLGKVRKVQKTVERVLSENTKTRDSDQLLILEVWQKQGLVLTLEQRYHFMSVANPESIRRTRQKLQQEGKYLPSPKIARERKLRSYEMEQAIPALKPRMKYNEQTRTMEIYE